MTCFFSAYKLPLQDEVTYETWVCLNMTDVSKKFFLVVTVLAGRQLDMMFN